jgi:hypothetical protein
MSGDIPLLPLDTSVAWTGTSLPFEFFKDFIECKLLNLTEIN